MCPHKEKGRAEALSALPLFCFRSGTVHPTIEMENQKSDVRLLLSEELTAIRSKIVEGKLVLFVGEQVSTLVSTDRHDPSIDDWWQIVNHSEVKCLLCSRK